MTDKPVQQNRERMIAKCSVGQKGLAHSRGLAEKLGSLAGGADSRLMSVNPVCIGQGYPSSKL
jgi:hypothetical protein